MFRVRASTGNLLQTWTGATDATAVLVARGKVFVIGDTSPGTLYQIDPAQPPGTVATVTSSLADFPVDIAYDGQHIWTTNSGSVSKITLNPLTVVNVTTGLFSPFGIVYDGSNIWVTDDGDGKLKQLDSNGNVLQSVTLGAGVDRPVFDGTNIWVPNGGDNTVSVVRASGGLAGTVLATLSGNGLNSPHAAAFDGSRILITNNVDGVSLWKATDFSPIANFLTGANTFPDKLCSDGTYFWVVLRTANKLARF